MMKKKIDESEESVWKEEDDDFVWTDEDEKEEQEIIRKSNEAVKRGIRVPVVVNIKSSILSVRMPLQLLKDLEITARAQGVKPATYARQAIEEKIAQEENTDAANRFSLLARLLPLIKRDINELEKVQKKS
jgi:hypothetical protein